MDLRVYVDGVARIICDLTRTTTVHDIIIALAQYKGKAGRYSLIQCAPDGTQITLSPNELTYQLTRDSDWTYILRQSPPNKDLQYTQKRSKSLDGHKEQESTSMTEIISPITSSFDQFRTIQSNNSFSTLSTANKKRSNIHEVFPSVHTNNSSNIRNSNGQSPPILHKRLSRTPIQYSYDNSYPIRYSRPKSAVPSSFNENSAFRIVHHPNNIDNQQQQQQQQYIALLQMLRSQEIQCEQQKQQLIEKENEIQYRETLLQQTKVYQEKVEHELQLLDEHDRRLTSECQIFSQEYTTDKLDFEYEYHKTLYSNYDHLQQKLTLSSLTLEQKKQLQEQIQLNIMELNEDIDEIKVDIEQDKKEINQYEYDLQRLNSTLKQQENLLNILTKRNEDIECIIQKHRHLIKEYENEIIQLNDKLINNLSNSSYHFHPTSSNDIVKPDHFQSMNSTLLKLCPSGIWV